MNKAKTAQDSKSDKKKPTRISTIEQAPKAFSTIVSKVNEIIESINDSGEINLVVKPPLKLVAADDGPPILSLDIDALAKMLRLKPDSPLGGGGGAGAGSSGAPAGYREQVVSLCEGSFSTNMTFLVKI